MPPDIIRGDHQWVGSAVIAIDPKQAARAARRGTVRILKDQTVDVLEAYCYACRIPWEKAVDTICTLGDHHRGGPIGVRAKRKGKGAPIDDPLAVDPYGP